MKWLIILFVIGWLWCTACEKTYDAARDKIEGSAKKTIEKNKDTIKKGTRKAVSIMDYIGHMTGWNHRFK